MGTGIYINPKTFKKLPLSENLTKEVASRSFVEGEFFSFFNSLPDPDPILRKLGVDSSVYKDLIADDQVSSTIQRRKMGVKSLEWQITKPEGVTDREADICEAALENLRKNDGAEKIKVKDLISQSLDALLWGTAVFEIVWEVSGGMWLPRKVQVKPANWFVYDNENRLRLKRKNDAEGELLTQEKYKYKFIVLRNEPTYENPYGDKVLSRCFWPVTFKRGGMKFYALFVEKYGMPHLTGKQPRGIAEKETEDFKNKLVAMIQDAVAVIPDDSSVEIHHPGGTSSSDIYERFIAINNRAIDKAILTNTLSTEQLDKGGYSSSKTGTEIEKGLAEQDKDFPEELFNELFRMIIDVNFGNGKYPIFEMYEEEGINKALAERDKTLSETGITFTKKYYETRYKLEADEFEVIDTFSSPPGTQDVTDTERTLATLKLNGAQIASAVAIVENVSKGDIPREAGINQLKVFLGLSDRQAAAVMGNAGTGKIIKADKVIDKNQASFAEREGKLSDSTVQTLAEKVVNQLPDSLLQMEIENVLKPVLTLIKESANFDEAREKLYDLYPQMDSAGVEETLRKLIFIAEIQGLSSGSKK